MQKTSAQKPSATEIDQQIERLSRDIAKSQGSHKLQDKRKELRTFPARIWESHDQNPRANEDLPDVEMTTH